MEKELAAAASAAGNQPSTESKCPVAHGASRPQNNAAWWPNQLNVNILHQHSPSPIPWARSSITPKSSSHSI